MRKRIITPVQQETAPPDLEWLNMEGLAEVEITSEDAAHPIDSALLPGRASGWRAAGPGSRKSVFFRLSATASADLAEFRGDPHSANARIRLALVAGWRAVFPGNRAAAVELQSPRRNQRDGRPSRRTPGGHGARVEYHSGHKWGKCDRFFGAVAACLIG